MMSLFSHTLSRSLQMESNAELTLLYQSQERGTRNSKQKSTIYTYEDMSQLPSQLPAQSTFLTMTLGI